MLINWKIDRKLHGKINEATGNRYICIDAYDGNEHYLGHITGYIDVRLVQPFLAALPTRVVDLRKPRYHEQGM